MSDANYVSKGAPSGAPFSGAQRAERYFEETPTEISQSAVSNAPGIVGSVPKHLVAVPQSGDNPSGSNDFETVLQRVAAQPATTASPVTVRPGSPAPSSPPRRERPALWGRRARAAAELEADRFTVRHSTWPRSVGVLVANPKGSVGKTPTALALGGVFASIRGGQTVVLEVTDDPGSLALRAEGPAFAGLGELVRDASTIRGAGELSGYTSLQTSFAAVVGSTRDRAPLGYVDVDNVTALLEFFYPVRIMDSGNQVTSSAFYGAVRAADVLVIPVLNAPDAVAGAEQLLRHLQRAGGHPAELAQSAIAIRLDDGRRSTAEATQHVTDALTAAGISTIVDVPFDPHIAERSTLSLARLRPATRDAYTRAAALVSDRLTDRLR